MDLSRPLIGVMFVSRIQTGNNDMVFIFRWTHRYVRVQVVRISLVHIQRLEIWVVPGVCLVALCPSKNVTNISLNIMAHLHCRRQTRVQIRTRTPNLMATLYYAEHVHIALTKTQIPAAYFSTGQEFEAEAIPKSVSGNVNEPFSRVDVFVVEVVVTVVVVVVDNGVDVPSLSPGVSRWIVVTCASSSLWVCRISIVIRLRRGIHPRNVELELLF